MWQSSLYDNKPKIPGENGPQDNIESQHVFILLHSQNFTISLLSFVSVIYKVYMHLSSYKKNLY